MKPSNTSSHFEDHKGLDQTAIRLSRQKYGSNIFIRNEQHPFIQMIIEVVTEPMFVLLSITCGIYLILGEMSEGILMMVALIFVSGISIYQTIRSNSAIKALHKINQSKAKVIREHKNTVIDREEMVMGDLMIIEEGDLIPADGKVINTHDFSVNESLLTGEAFSTVKLVDADPKVFSGTQVVSGYALAEVTAIGNASKIGQLGISMQETETGKTLLQTQIDQFVKGMAIFGGIAFVLVWLINYLATGKVYESLLQGLTLAMSALPEEIPVAFSTFLALGAWRLIRKKVLTKQPQTVESLGAASVICLDKTGTITENKMVVEEIYSFPEDQVFSLHTLPTSGGLKVLEDAMLASEVEPFDPMEIAIHNAYQKHIAEDIRSQITMIHEYPLAGNPPMMTHIYRNHQSITLISCKGSWEKIISICHLKPEAIQQIKKVADMMAGHGMRVLGTAHVTHTSIDFPDLQENFNWNFSGLIALSDPPKKNIKKVFDQFYEAGVQIKMITGDYPATALAIAGQSGLKNANTYLSGDDVLRMSENELMKKVQVTTIFARMVPEAKLKVINTLKLSGEVVAMTGDGVNDGPALRAADIGIAMGHRGTEIARKAANIVLIDDDLENMVEAIRAGRKIYHNLKKAFRYIITIHIPIIMVVTLPLILGWQYPNIFTPIHVIFLELIMGPTCSIIYENEPIESYIMQSGPRKKTESLFSWNELSVSIFQGLVITAVVLSIYQYTVISDFSEEITRTLTFTTLIFCNIFLTLVNRSFTKSIFQTIRYKNNLIPLIFTITLLIWLSAIKIDFFKNLFQFEDISWRFVAICLAASAIAVFWIEVVKWWRK